MAWIDGYEPITPADKSPGSAPGTEVTNESRPSPGPSWASKTTSGSRPSASSGKTATDTTDKI